MGMIGSGMIGNTFSGGVVPNPILLSDGSGSAPSLAWGTGNKGFYTSGGDDIRLSLAGSLKFVFGQQSFWLYSDVASFIMGGSADINLVRDAANTLALKNANAEQQFNIYSGNGAYGLIKSKQELVTTTAAATALTAAGFIPDGAVLLAISTYIQTAITTAGLTGYNIGDGADADRWGAIAGDIVGTKSNNSDWTATTIQAFIAAQAITLTADGANFPAGGKIRVCMTYLASSEPTS